MVKFVIECPVCGRYTEASTGFFAKKKLTVLADIQSMLKQKSCRQRYVPLAAIPKSGITALSSRRVSSLQITSTHRNSRTLPQNNSEPLQRIGKRITH